MDASARPRRSVLYMPGSNTRALDKGRSLAADALILDLEDAVAPDAKLEARDNIVEAVAAGGYGRREVIVRINALETAWGRTDLDAVAKTPADAILLPKVESAAQVQEAAKLMAQAGAHADMAIMCMMETPKGVLHAEEIAGSHDRLSCLVMGTSDLVKDLQAEHTAIRLPVVTSLGLCILAARAHGLAVVDGVHLDLQDDEGFEAACIQGRELGFDGKTLIHPKTIETANRVFAPSQDAIEWSRRVIDAHAEAQQKGQGVVVLDGKLVENLHVENAKRLVSLAEAIEKREKEMAEA